jgi:glycosyltransferase involved in cell wall biosynthesis
LTRTIPSPKPPSSTFEDYSWINRNNFRVSGGGRKKKNLRAPLFSIITVVKNGQDALARTIASVQRQHFDDYEYIVVDGGSSDDTVRIIKAHDDAIDFWVSEPDHGISDAFNKGIALSTGRYIQLLNSGDILINAAVLNHVSCFSNEAIVTGFASFDSSTVPPQPLSNADPLRKKAMISHQASFVRRDVYEVVGLYSPPFTIRMDYEFWLRALKRYKFVFLEEILVEFHAGASMEHLQAFYQEEYFANGYHDQAGIMNYCRVSQKFMLRKFFRMFGRRY